MHTQQMITSEIWSATTNLLGRGTARIGILRSIRGATPRKVLAKGVLRFAQDEKLFSAEFFGGQTILMSV